MATSTMVSVFVEERRVRVVMESREPLCPGIVPDMDGGCALLHIALLLVAKSGSERRN